MYNQRRFKTAITGSKFVPEYLLRKYINKQSFLKMSKLHPRAKMIFNEMIREPAPLKFKLQKIADDKNFHSNEPLGNTFALPFQVNTILNIYFKISRTHTNNLPVFTEYRNDNANQMTIVKKIYGDVNVFNKFINIGF
jgi:hypothetical protein